VAENRFEQEGAEETESEVSVFLTFSGLVPAMVQSGHAVGQLGTIEIDDQAQRDCQQRKNSAV
jgi:hypothetical protein